MANPRTPVEAQLEMLEKLRQMVPVFAATPEQADRADECFPMYEIAIRERGARIEDISISMGDSPTLDFKLTFPAMSCSF